VLPVRSILNRCDSTACRLNGRLILIEVRVCCKYWFAAVYAEYMELDATEFEKRIYVKQGPKRICRRKLRGVLV